MSGQIRDMRRSDWRRILKRRYVSGPGAIAGLPGVVSLIAIDAVAEPLTVRGEGGEVVIADAGYSWLQFAPREARFWLTAMYTPEGALVQIYFDITGGSRFDDPANPTFRDMYLDVVVTGRRGIRVLDRDELDEALAAGIVSPEEHARALRDCDGLLALLRRDMDALIGDCGRVRRELAALLDR